MDGDNQLSGSFDHLNGKTPSNGCHKRTPKKSDAPAEVFPLVAKDGLYVCIFPDGSSTSAEAKARTAGVERIFSPAFVSDWNSLPAYDRERILTYLRDEPKDLSSTWSPSPFTPLIEIRDLPFSSPSCQHCGMEITFPAALIEMAPESLPFEIALVLARLLRYANHRHWHLVVQMIEKPLKRWERSLGKKVTEKARDEKLDELEEEFLQVHEAELAATVRSWGIPENPAPCEGDERGFIEG